jgi:hypothetical protein
MAIAKAILSMEEGKEMAGQGNHNHEPFNKMITRPAIEDGVQKEALCSPT